MIRCANYMNEEGRKKSIDEYEAGGPDDVIHYDPSNFKVCMECDFGEPTISTITQAIDVLNHDLGVKVALDVKRMTGESISQICFKERKQPATQFSKECRDCGHPNECKSCLRWVK